MIPANIGFCSFQSYAERDKQNAEHDCIRGYHPNKRHGGRGGRHGQKDAE
jgi:hypothetical protein